MSATPLEVARRYEAEAARCLDAVVGEMATDTDFYLADLAVDYLRRARELRALTRRSNDTVNGVLSAVLANTRADEGRLMCDVTGARAAVENALAADGHGDTQ